MTTHNLNGEKRPEATGGAKGEVVTPQASEFLTLKQLIRQLKDVSIEEAEDKITVRKGELEIALENWGSGDYDYWVYTIKAEDGNDKAEIYISSKEQSFDLVAYPKNQKVDISYEIKNERIEEDLFICVKAEYAIDEIKLILNKCDEYGILGGVYEYFYHEFLDTIL